MAAQDLSQLATLKAWGPISAQNSADDFTLSRLLTAVSQDFQRATLRPDLLKSTYTEVHEGDGGSRLILFHWPIISITSLQIAGATIAKSADKMQPGWYIDQDIDPERTWNVYLVGYAFTDRQPVQIEYEAGYVQPGATPANGEIMLPGDIEQAVLDWCAYRYRERPNVAATSRRSTEGESVNTQLIDAPPNVLQVIERYKRCVPSMSRRDDDRERMNRAGKRNPAAPSAPQK